MRASPVTADPAGAERFERDAEALASRGDFLGAAERYRNAYREYPRPDLMCNVGVAYYKAKDLPRAHRYLDQCVTSGASLDPAFISNVRTVLTAVEQKLVAGDYTPINFIIQPQSATTAFASGVHDESLVGSRQVWVPFGSYKVTIHAEGYTDRILEIVADNRERAELSVKLDPVILTAPPPPPEPEPGTALQALPPTIERVPERSYLAPIIASASTGALGGLALGVYLTARSQAAETTRDGVTLGAHTEAADTARTRQRISLIVGIVAGAAAIGAGVLWYRALTSPRARVEVGASGSGASLSLVGRW